ncbi:MAG: hypothetical protein ACPKPY_09795 [Nitrososphaeraceae archaeon]
MRKFEIYIVLSVVLVTSLISTTFAEKEFTEYESDLLGIQLSFPQDWEKIMNEETLDWSDEKSDRISFNFDENTFVVLVKDSDKETLQEIIQDSVDSSHRMSSYSESEMNLIDLTDTTLSGERAKKTIFEQTIFGKSSKVLQVKSLVDGKEYTITYRSNIDKFDEHLSNVEKIIDSIKILN